MIRILHAADFHLDSPFDALPDGKAALRRKEQRELLFEIAELSEKERVKLVLLSGDLFDGEKSYFETKELLVEVFGRIRAKVFISPGNHDYFSLRSPYARGFSNNVHIFKSPAVEKTVLEDLGCAVYGAGFISAASHGLLGDFRSDENALVSIMVLHGEVGNPESRYNPIKEEQIAASGLDYLALGHVHSFSGLRRAGGTNYAWPGCPEGRGFDETGQKGIIVGDVGKGGCDIEFRPLKGRRYGIINVDLSESADAFDALKAALPSENSRDIVRIVLNGEYSGDIDIERLSSFAAEKFFHAEVKDSTRLRRDIWAQSGEDTLRGLFLKRLREKFDAADERERSKIELAVRYGLAALERGEEPRV